MTRPRLQHASMIIPPGAQESVRAFYGGVLGLEEKQPPHTLSHRHLVWFAAGEGELELHFMPDPTPPEEEWHSCRIAWTHQTTYRKTLRTCN